MRVVSLNARRAQEVQGSDEIEVVLFRAVTPDGTIVRLSTDTTERLSLDPLKYGTVSTWRADVDTDAATHEFYFVGAKALLPDDQEDAPQAGSIVLDMLDSDIGEELRSTHERSEIDVAVVLASDPNTLEAEYLGLELMNSSGDAGQIVLQFSREPTITEPWPKDRLTRQRFPGLHP